MVLKKNSIIIISSALVIIFSTLVFFFERENLLIAKKMSANIAENTAIKNAKIIENEIEKIVNDCLSYKFIIEQNIEATYNLDGNLDGIAVNLNKDFKVNNKYFDYWCVLNTKSIKAYISEGKIRKLSEIEKVKRNVLNNTHRGIYISNPYYLTRNDSIINIISFSAPINYNNEKVGNICIDIRLSKFHEIFSEINELRSGYATLFSNNKICIVHPEQELVGLLNKSLPINEQYVKTLRDTTIKGNYFSDFLKLNVYRVYSPIEFIHDSKKWFLIISVPQLGAEDWYSKIKNSSLIVGVFFSIILVLIIYFSVQRWLYEIRKRRDVELKHKELKSMQTKLISTEKMSSLGQLTAGIAHEINNPINFVSANVIPLKRDVLELKKLIENNNLDNEDVQYVFEEINDLLEGIESGAQRTIEIVRGLQDFSRTDEDKFKNILLEDIINSCLTILRHKLNNIKIEKKLNKGLYINCVPGRLNQVVLNMIYNSIHAIDEKKINNGVITIESKTENDYAIISIKDNGIGMESKVLEKIFEPFFTTKEVGEGTGLGLAISYGIIKQHKGEIKVESEFDNGSEFKIILPQH